MYFYVLLDSSRFVEDARKSACCNLPVWFGPHYTTRLERSGASGSYLSAEAMIAYLDELCNPDHDWYRTV